MGAFQDTKVTSEIKAVMKQQNITTLERLHTIEG